MSLLRLGIVEQRALWCRSLQAFFERQPDFEVAWGATTPVEARQKHAELPADAVLLVGEGTGGVPRDLIRSLSQAHPAARVVMLMSDDCDALVRLAMNAGASGYFLKTDPPETVVDGIRDVVSGRPGLSPALQGRVRVDPLTGERRFRTPNLLDVLTDRQVEIVTHLANGASSKEIANRLQLSERSVSSHAYRIMKRLNLHDRVDLARFAIREGLVPL